MFVEANHHLYLSFVLIHLLSFALLSSLLRTPLRSALVICIDPQLRGFAIEPVSAKVPSCARAAAVVGEHYGATHWLEYEEV